MSEYKIIFSGPMGSGKTTALAAVSDAPPVRTEVKNNAPQESDKPTTTVAMDYGDVQLGEGEVLRLYGTPGQERFAFMRGILARGSLGIVLLIDASRADPSADLAEFVESFDLGEGRYPFVVGMTKADLTPNPETVQLALQERLQALGSLVPCFQCDVRDRQQVRVLLSALLAMIETEPTVAA